MRFKQINLRKLWLSLLLLVGATAIAIPGIQEVAEGSNVAEINGTGYATLANAIAAVPANGTETTITMIADVSVVSESGAALTIAANKNVVLNLNGKIITLSNHIANSGTLTIQDGTGTGKISSNAGYTFVTNGGTLTINSGTYTNTATDLILQRGGNITINGGSFTSESTVIHVDSNGEGHRLTIANGTFTAEKGDAVYVAASAPTISISGGEFITKSYVPNGNPAAATAFHVVSYCTGGTITISGGTFKALSTVYGSRALSVGSNPGISVTGGDFYSNAADGRSVTSETNGILAGGTYDGMVPSNYVANGKYAYPNNDYSRYTIEDYDETRVNGLAVAKIGDTYYTSLEEVSSEISEGCTVTLLKDLDYSEKFTFYLLDNMTFDGNGHTLSGNIQIDCNNGSGVARTGITIKDTKFVNTTATDGYVIRASKLSGDFTVTGCTFDNTKGQAIQCTTAAGADVTITGNTFKNGTGSKRYINLYGTGTNDASNIDVTITGNIFFENSNTENLRLNTFGANNNFDINGNYFEDPTHSRIESFNSAKDTFEFTVYGLNNGEIDTTSEQTYIATGATSTATITLATMVAQIGDVKYRTLAAAVAAVPTDGKATTITMIADEAVVAGVTIAANQNVVLELNGKTVSGNTDSSTSYALITNKGTLVIQDNTDTNLDGTGTGLITTYISNPDGGDVPGYASNTITNNGNLTVKSGKIVNNGKGYACYAIDNQTNGNLYDPILIIDGGRMQQMNAYTYAVRMFANSTTNVNKCEVNGGVIEGGYGLWLQTPNNNANMANLVITGGTFNSRDGRALYAGGSNKRDVSKTNISISGGIINGIKGAFLGADTEFNSISVSGGRFLGFGVPSAGGTKFITGGVYESIDLFVQNRMPNEPIIADGFKCVLDGGLYYVVPDSDPRDAVDFTQLYANKVYYYWLEDDGSKSGGIYDFYAPFVGPDIADVALMDGEFIELLGNVKMDKDVTYIEELPSSWNADPIFKGGTFTLTFGEYNIDLNGHVFPIPTGVTILTDKQTDIFSAVDEGYKVVETAVEGGYQYTVAQKEYVAKIGEEQYYSLAEAFEAATDGQTITVLTDIDLPSTIAVTKQVTLDLAGKTISNTSDLWGGDNWSFFSVRANGNLTVTGNGTIDAKENDCYTFDVRDGGNLTIKNGTFTGNISCVYLLNQAGTGVSTCNIEGGTFSIKQLAPDVQDDKYRYLLNCLDASYASNTVKFNVTGGSFVNFNPANNQAEGVETNFCAAGYEAVQNGDVWTVQKAPVAKIGETTYTSLAEAFEDAQDGQTITVLTDIDLPSTIAVTKQVTLDLDGKTISNTSDLWGGDNWSFFSVRANGNLTVTGNGTIDAKENDCYTFDVRDGGNLTIKNGTFTGNISCVYLLNQAGTGVSTCNIEGGTFSIKQLAPDVQDDKYRYLLNCLDASYASNTVKFNVTGGSYVNFNPANNQAEGEKTNFCAAGYEAVQNGDVWTVQRIAVAKIGETKYYSLAEAVAAVPADGAETTITMIADEAIDVVGYAVTIAANQNVVLDLAGHTISGQCTTGNTSALIRNLGTLKIEDSTDTNKDGSGNGKLTMSAEPFWVYSEADPGGYASNLIRNEKNLTVESGLLYNNGTGSACYAIDNYSAGNVTINGGKVDAAKASAIRLFSPNGQSLTVNDGIIGHYNSDDDYSYMGIQLHGGTNANVTITDGTIAGDYAFYANNTGGNIAISGGTFDGYVGFASAYEGVIGITGGAFNKWVYKWGTETKFISGGIYAAKGNVYTQFIADEFILTDNTDEATKEDYPYAVGHAEIYYYWFTDGVKKGGYYQFIDPFKNDYLMDGEFITLLKDVTMTENVTCPFDKGNFTLTFGDYTITKGSYSVSIKAGVKVYTDKQTNIFTSPDGKVVETVNESGGYIYSVEAGVFELVHGEPYPYPEGKAATSVTYRRTFTGDEAGNYRCWYVPFDYTVKEEDAENFDFFKIHMIAGSGNNGGVVNDNKQVYVYIENVTAGTVLRGNRPYVVRPKSALTDHVFSADNITQLYAEDHSSRLHEQTTEYNYDFYGTYRDYKASAGDEFITLSKSGHTSWNASAAATLHSYVWYIKVESRSDNADYAKPNFIFIESNEISDASGINTNCLEDEIEGYYTLDGTRVEKPIKGVTIIKYKNGKTKKISVK